MFPTELHLHLEIQLPKSHSLQILRLFKSTKITFVQAYKNYKKNSFQISTPD